MRQDRAALLAAYRRTAYCVDDAGHTITARVGERSAELDSLLKKHGATGGAFMTAWNPGSELRSIEENREAGARLARHIGERGLPALPHQGVGDGWREEGLFVPGLAVAEAIRLAQKFGQNAIAYAASGEPLSLLFTALMPGRCGDAEEC